MDKAPQNINVDELVADIDSKIPANLKQIYQKTILSGMRILFDKRSHKMMLDQIDKPGPMDQKLAEGIITLLYMLWQQSNQTLPPQIIVPVTVVMTLRAFEFLQKSGEPEATNEVLGEALAQATTGIMSKFGVDEAQLQGMAQSQQNPQQPGLINQQMEGQ